LLPVYPVRAVIRALRLSAPVRSRSIWPGKLTGTMANHTFDQVPDRPNFPQQEEEIIKYWGEIDAFQTALRESKDRKPYTFYDGPPFATGLPHYGHILAGTLKDVVTRYAHQTGHYVERRFGWDCHGLPVEQIIDQKLGVKNKDDVAKIGIKKYNEECEKIVTQYTGEWRQIITRLGRWIDFDNDYKTMDPSFMESGWWVFKQLFLKGMVYRAFRVMPYSTACCTPLANFEVSQNYKDVSDPSVIILFSRVGATNERFAVWTTTPWTLPSNLALTVNPKLQYLRVQRKSDGMVLIVGKDRWNWVRETIKEDPAKFAVLEEVLGSSLVGVRYEPLLPYFKAKARDSAFQVIAGDFVTTDAGTCIVHTAPAFGEDDFGVCVKAGICDKDGDGMVCPIDDSGVFGPDVTDFNGQHVKASDKDIMKKLKGEDKVLHNGSEVHSYPHCWRSDTPLIYKAIPSWFVKVECIRDKLLENNEKTYWVPDNVKQKRFRNWLADARDWLVSRNRYWGLPIPLWVSEDFEEIICIGSVEELEQLSGVRVENLHRQFVDHITIPSKQGKGQLRRIPEVFDCWFESGSMPYAQVHYPFENKEKFESNFPAHFIAEGLDQTRGWFYTLMVLSTHLFDKPAWQNLVVNGLVLASDGKKMSKRLKNYPDPAEVMDRVGADAIRMYLCNSGVMRAEPLKFQEQGVRDVVKDVFLPMYNSYRFLVQESYRYELATGKTFQPSKDKIRQSTNQMDIWVYSACQSLITFVRQEMEAYRLYTVVPHLVNFINQLTNWYIRLNRDRMRGSGGDEEQLQALSALYDVLLDTTILLAPVVPFITETLYLNLRKALPEGDPRKDRSVHFVMMPDPDTAAVRTEVERQVKAMQAVVNLGRTIREKKKVGLKTPVKSLQVVSSDQQFLDDVITMKTYIESELNVDSVETSADVSSGVTVTGKLDFATAAKKVGKDMKKVMEEVKKLTEADFVKFEAEGTITLGGYTLVTGDLKVTRECKGLGGDVESLSDENAMLHMDFKEDEDILLRALAREVANRVQKLRKEAKLVQDDPVVQFVVPGKGKRVSKVLSTKGEYLENLLRRKLFGAGLLQEHLVRVAQDNCNVDGEEFEVVICLDAPCANTKELKALAKDDVVADGLRQWVVTQPSVGSAITANIAGKTYEMKEGKHYASLVSKATW